MKFKAFFEESSNMTRFTIGTPVKHKHSKHRGVVNGPHTFGWPVALPGGNTAMWHDGHCEHDHEAAPTPAPVDLGSGGGDMGGGDGGGV